MKKEKFEPASPGSYARLGLVISNGIIDATDGKISKTGMKELLQNEVVVRDITKKVAAEILKITLAPRPTPEQEKVFKFYKEIFDLDIEANGLPAQNSNFTAIEYIDSRLTGPKLFAGMCHPKVFGESVYKNDYSLDIDKMIREQQARPKSGYWFSHKGGVEPDAEHLNKSYNDFCKDGNKYMTPYEGIITAMRYKYETGKMLDIKGITRFHGLGHDGFVISMCCDDDGRFYMDWFIRGYQFSVCGPRQVNF